jgi:thioredoxin
MGKQSNVVPMGKREFKDKVFDYTFSREWSYKGEMPAVIDFYADWCAPCKQVAPILGDLSVEYEGRVKFYKINTEKDPEVAKAFGISSIPTLLFIKPGDKPFMVRGVQTARALRNSIDRIVAGEKGGFLQNILSLGRKG